MTKGTEDGKPKDKLATRDQRKTEESRSRHEALRVVEEPIDAGVSKLGRISLEKEKVGIKPAKVTEDLVGGQGGPDMEGDKHASESVPEKLASNRPV